MTQTAATPQPEVVDPDLRENFEPIPDSRVVREGIVRRARLLWCERQRILKSTGVGLVAATLIAFVIPKRFESTTRLMPPDSQSASSLALMAGLAGQVGGFGAIASDLLGVRSTGALFVAVLQSWTVQDRIIQRFDLKKVYGVRLDEIAREKLANNTRIGEDRKSGIIIVNVTDRDPKRAAAIAGAYVEELDTLMAQLTTSAAHRERVFLEQRLNAVTQDLESAEKDFSQFASKNAAIDILAQGKASVEAAATLAGQLIAAQSQLEGLKQIYTESNVRVRATQARITELQRQLEKFTGNADSSRSSGEFSNDSSYPTLRQLPLLGVPYADKFRRLKVEEAVFETLTKEYELTKVQEAKEIPTVKVLDPPEIPERKIFPPRLLIIFLGGFFTLLLTAFWVLATSHWQEIDQNEPGKLLLQEVFGTLKAHSKRSAGWIASKRILRRANDRLPGQE